MYKNKRFLAIIPARSGSKGLPDKNIKDLNGKPMIAYTIDACLKANLFDDIIVSTDSIHYANLSVACGASVPFLRPKELSTDTSSSHQVILHVLKELQSLGKTYDYFILLQPTSPLRNEKNIIEAVDLLLEKDANSVVGVCELEYSAKLIITLNDQSRLDFAFDDKEQLRRQDLVKQFRINGALYISGTTYFLEHQSFYKEKSYPYIMNSLVALDIDTMDEFRFAQYALKI